MELGDSQTTLQSDNTINIEQPPEAGSAGNHLNRITMTPDLNPSNFPTICASKGHNKALPG